MTTQVVLVTGALTGIGRATAEAFAREGAKVVVSGRHAGAGEKLAEELRALGAEAAFVQADVRKDEEVGALVDKTVARFGRLDVAVNNAGTEGTPGPVVDQTADSYAAVFDTNVLGVLLSLKHELRAMQTQGSGAVINITSVVAERAFPGASVYSASKAAVEKITEIAALEAVGSGIRVNAVSPGPVETPMLNRFTGNEEGKAGLLSMVPMKRAGTPDEVAQAVLFLASGKASFITGRTLGVDGGVSLG